MPSPARGRRLSRGRGAHPPRRSLTHAPGRGPLSWARSWHVLRQARCVAVQLELEASARRADADRVRVRSSCSGATSRPIQQPQLHRTAADRPWPRAAYYARPTRSCWSRAGWMRTVRSCPDRARGLRMSLLRTQPSPGCAVEAEVHGSTVARAEVERAAGMVRDQRSWPCSASSAPAVLAGPWRSCPRSAPTTRPKSGTAGWRVLSRPGGAPFHALAATAARLAVACTSRHGRPVCATGARAAGRGATGVQQVVVELGLRRVRLLLLVDQFEELFRFTGVDRRAHRHATDEPRDRSDEAAGLGLGPARRQPDRYASRRRRDHHALDFVGVRLLTLGLPSRSVDAGQSCWCHDVGPSSTPAS